VNSSIVISLAFLGCAAVVCGWMHSDYTSVQSRHIILAEQLSQMTKGVAEIRQASSQASQVALEFDSPSQLQTRLESAMKLANIPLTSTKSISPQQTRRLGQTDYQIRAVDVRLVDLELGAALRFLSELQFPSDGFAPTEIVLTPQLSGANGAQEKWTLEATLTQTVFSPKT